MSLHDACLLCLWNLVGFITLRFSFLKPGVLLCSFFARITQLSPRMFDGFFIFSIFRINKKCLSIFEQYRVWVSRLPRLVFLSSQRLFSFLEQTSGQKFSGLVVACIFVTLFSDHIHLLGRFSFSKGNFVNPFQESDPRPHSNNPCVFVATSPDLYE